MNTPIAKTVSVSVDVALLDGGLFVARLASGKTEKMITGAGGMNGAVDAVAAAITNKAARVTLYHSSKQFDAWLTAQKAWSVKRNGLVIFCSKATARVEAMRKAHVS